MITTLRIENFALIDEATIRFNEGFTVITGETGSGKSILLNALHLILGERADFSVIGKLKDKSIVEAEIDLKAFDMHAFFEENELDYFDQCIVRREISTQGRSRAFINDTPVGLNVLKAFSSQMIHIHSQYNTLELKEPSYQLHVLDVLSGCAEEAKTFSTKFGHYQSGTRKLVKLKDQLSTLSAQADYNDFQLKELEGLNLDKFNYEELQQELSKGEHSDELKEVYAEVIAALENENGVLDTLVGLRVALQKQVAKDPAIASILERLESARIELNDIAEESERLLEGIEIDPERIALLSEQLDAYNRILFKHKLTDQDALMALMNELNSEAENSQELADEINALEVSLSEQVEQLKKWAKELHDKRKAAIPQIQKELQEALEGLKLTDTSFSFDLSELPELTAFGTSKVEMLFSPNVGIAPVPVHKAASGGELSRVMLALQSLMSSRIKLRSVLFDEIDTGVSGDVAQKVGATLAKMGQGMQVIAITHLPQVAAKGTQHLKVAKKLTDGRTLSSVTELSPEERVEETARLMSGDIINEAALENARALMN